jgi:hypothetical protein
MGWNVNYLSNELPLIQFTFIAVPCAFSAVFLYSINATLWRFPLVWAAAIGQAPFLSHWFGSIAVLYFKAFLAGHQSSQASEWMLVRFYEIALMPWRTILPLVAFGALCGAIRVIGLKDTSSKS